MSTPKRKDWDISLTIVFYTNPEQQMTFGYKWCKVQTAETEERILIENGDSRCQ